jgi:hypothetical protein
MFYRHRTQPFWQPDIRWAVQGFLLAFVLIASPAIADNDDTEAISQSVKICQSVLKDPDAEQTNC